MYVHAAVIGTKLREGRRLWLLLQGACGSVAALYLSNFPSVAVAIDGQYRLASN